MKHIVVILFVLLTVPAWSKTWYVATTGNDGTGTGALATPWATPSHACGAVSAFGDKISIAGGTYTDNTTCVLAPGISYLGVVGNAASVTVNTTATPSISAVSSCPSINGSNEIAWVTFNGGGSNGILTSTCRNNQLIHDLVLSNFPSTDHFTIQGKPPTFDSSETTTTCHAHATATYTTPNGLCSVPPGPGDWATGVKIYNNSGVTVQWLVHTIKGAQIYNNTVDNSGGAGVSCFGHTSYFWSGVDFYGNTLKLNTNTVTAIAMEVWEVSGDTRIHDNIFSGWTSWVSNFTGTSTPYSMELYNNDYSSNIVTTGAVAGAIEINEMNNVLIANNLIFNTGGNNTWTAAMYADGCFSMSGVTFANNVVTNINGPGAVLDASVNTAACILYPAQLSNISFLNNVFDNMNGSGAVRFANGTPNALGTISGVVLRNNILETLTYGAKLNAGSDTTKIWGNFFDHNVSHTVTGDVDGGGSPSLASTFAITASTSLTPNVVGAGNRLTQWYYPAISNSNLARIGVDVGLPYCDTAPDVGLLRKCPAR